MNELPGKTAYIGKIKNDVIDVKTIVMAENETDAREKVKMKFVKDLDKFYDENEIEIYLFKT